MEGEKKDSPVFHGDDIKTSKSNSDKEYFVNVINDPFQQWLLRKRPAKVKAKQDFETPITPPEKPEEKPKSPQCRTTIRLTTERLRRDSSKYKIPFVLLSVCSVILLIAAGVLVYLNFFGEKQQTEKTVYVDVYHEITKEPEKCLEEPSDEPETPEAPAENPEDDSEDTITPARGGGEELNA